MKILFCIANKKAEEYIINEIQKRSNDEANLTDYQKHCIRQMGKTYELMFK